MCRQHGDARRKERCAPAQVREHAPGDEVQLSLVREGSLIEVSATLGQREE